MLLTYAEQQILVSASLEGLEAVNIAIDAVRTANPRAFHTSETLAQRRFHDQPLQSIPYCGYRYPLPIRGNW